VRAGMLEEEPMAPSRALVCGTAKTVHRYRAAVENLCPSVEARALEVLCFQPDPAALRRAALRVLEAQDQAQKQKETPVLHVIVTSAAAVRMLQETIDEIRGGSHERNESKSCVGPAVLTIRGCGTEAACRKSSSFANVLFCGDRLCDVYAYLTERTLTPTLLLGVRSGGDRSYRTDPILRTAIEFIGVYDTCEAPSATTAVMDALKWAGSRCHVVVTSSKSAELVAQVVKSDRGAIRREITFIAQGKSTAAALQASIQKQSLECEQYRVLVAPKPTAEAVAAVIHDHPTGAYTADFG
jgi:uroporphyrinogen-III synthase